MDRAEGLLRLAGPERVSGYTRRTSTGKLVRVQAYRRSARDIASSMIDEARSAGEDLSEHDVRVRVVRETGAGPSRSVMSKVRTEARVKGVRMVAGIPAPPPPPDPAGRYSLDDVDEADARITHDPTVADEGYEGTLWRGVSVDLPPDLAAAAAEALAGPGDESEIGRQFAVGEGILAYLLQHPEGLGRHWSDKYSFAKTAARVGDAGKRDHLIIQAQYAEEAKETDPSRIETFWAEGEVTLKPKAGGIKITAIMFEGYSEGMNFLREPVVL